MLVNFEVVCSTKYLQFFPQDLFFEQSVFFSVNSINMICKANKNLFIAKVYRESRLLEMKHRHFLHSSSHFFFQRIKWLIIPFHRRISS